MKYLARFAAIVCCVTLFLGMSSCKKDPVSTPKEYLYTIQGEIKDVNTLIDPSTGQILPGTASEVRTKLENAINQLTGLEYNQWTTKDIEASTVKAATDEAINPYMFNTDIVVNVQIVKKTLDKDTNTTTEFTIAVYEINTGH